jgi:hypothetical protein
LYAVIKRQIRSPAWGNPAWRTLAVDIHTHTRKGLKNMADLGKHKRKLVALLAGLAAAGVVSASAASLGGLTSADLGSDDQIVASCDSDGITVGYTYGYNAAAQRYNVTAVNFTNVAAACSTKAASVSLRNGVTNLGTTNVASITVALNAFSITLGAPVAATDVTGISLVISG